MQGSDSLHLKFLKAYLLINPCRCLGNNGKFIEQQTFSSTELILFVSQKVFSYNHQSQAIVPHYTQV